MAEGEVGGGKINSNLKMQNAKLQLKNRNWQKVKIKKIGKVITGKTPSTFDSSNFGGPYPFITIPDLKNQRYIEKTERTLSEKGAEVMKNLKLPPKAVMVSCLATVGEIGITVKESFTNQQINSVICDEDKVVPEFLYYYLKYAKPRLLKYSGSVYTNISKSKFEDFEIEIPGDINEQKRIADILSAFDEKIELNNRINQILEEMAQAIFKEWFVKFRFPGWQKVKFVDSEMGKIPEGWKVRMLPEIFDFREGPGIRHWQYTSSGCRFINIRLIKNNDIDVKLANFISEREAYGKYKHFFLQERDMVVSTSGTLGRTAIVRKEHLPLLLNTSVIRFRPKDGKSYGFMYQFLKSDYFRNKLSSMASGSAQPNFGPVHLKQIEVLVPEKNILKAFNDLIDPIYKKIISNLSENQRLSALRDLLLPKLMSGEIRV